jgi:ketosteroid isomerase-like protein
MNIAERLRSAVAAHDLDALVDCFAEDYVNETPVHPGRGFTGRAQVRENWGRIFAAVPDVAATTPRVTVDGATVWSEWEMTGTRPDGSPHLMRGVMIFTVADDRATQCRFYLEPVDAADDNVHAAVTQIAQDE